MKNIFLLLLLFTGIVKGQIVNIPDANFKAKLISLGLDTDGDGEIQINEASIVETLDISESNISDLTGIESFTSLLNFNCSYNQITSINENSVSNLMQLFCTNNSLTSLNISSLNQLKDLKCSFNQLTTLDLSGLSQLNSVECNSNQLTSINLSGLSSLQTFDCSSNYLSNIDLTDANGVVTFSCSNNQLSSISLSNMLVLQNLIISENQITNINLTGLTNLATFKCNNNQIASLNLTQLVNLTTLECEGNLLSSIDPSALILLENFSCHNNQLSALDVSNLVNLKNFDCSLNNLITINIAPLIHLEHFNCHSNQLTTLDLTQQTKLRQISCSNNLLSYLDLSQMDSTLQGVFPNGIDFINNPNLTNVNLKNGLNLIDFWIIPDTFSSGCPNLRYICADLINIQTILYRLETEGNNLVQVNSYCSFNPGGDYNTITGNVLYDLSSNGCDVDGTSNPYLKVNLNDGTNSGSAFTNSTGNYTFYTQNGDFIVTPEVENPSYFNFSPTSSILNFPVVDNSTQTQNFCMTANGVHPDVEIVVLPIDDAVPGSEPRYKIIYRNKGNQIQSGTYSVSFNDNFMSWIAATPNELTITPGLLTWNYTNLNPFETRIGEFTMRIENVPFANPGDTFDFVATINPIPGDETPLDNVSTYTQKVVATAVVNNITCIEGSTLSVDEVGEYLHYNINFRNQSLNNATNVVVKCIIDPTKYDISSFQLQYASHEVITIVTGNVIEVIFKNINLVSAISNPIGGHGNVLFKIKTLPTLVVDDEVLITANIYFDYDSPLTTNDARTAIAALSKISFNEDKSTIISPNPAKNIVFVSSKNIIKSIELYDVQGRLLQMSIENETNTTLDISNKSDGIYFLKVTTEKGSSVEKLVKEN